MPQVIVTEDALLGLEHCRGFLEAAKAQEAVGRVGRVIAQHFLRLESAPDIGRPDDELPALRELVIPFGEAGYVGLYRYAPGNDVVHVLAFRHQKEAGY